MQAVETEKPAHPDRIDGRTGFDRLSPKGGPQEGRFIWQLVGVLATYGSICFTGAKV